MKQIVPVVCQKMSGNQSTNQGPALLGKSMDRDHMVFKPVGDAKAHMKQIGPVVFRKCPETKVLWTGGRANRLTHAWTDGARFYSPPFDLSVERGTNKPQI